MHIEFFLQPKAPIVHFDRILLNVELYNNDFLFFFTVSVNVLCFHVTYGRDSERACQLLLLAATCYGSDVLTKTTTATREQCQERVRALHV